MTESAQRDATEFPYLLSQGQIGPLRLRNRIIMPPMGTNYGEPGGFAGRRIVDYYRARAAGGAGMIIVEVTSVDYPRGKVLCNQLSIDDDRYMPGLSKLAATIKGHGAAAMIQIHHGGREAEPGDDRIELVAPSPIPTTRKASSVPRALTTDEIAELVERFAAAADRARRAGFDGVVVHCAHQYLLAEFLSPASNKRQDEYGGSLANRARFSLEAVRAVRQRVPKDFVVTVRFNAADFSPGGITIEDSVILAQWFQEAGVDALDVSAGGPASTGLETTAPARASHGFLLPLVKRIKGVATVPVIGVGRLNTPELAEAALREGNCDFVALGRVHIADPEFANKVASGRARFIRPCLACKQCQWALHDIERPGVICATNPMAGREGEPVSPAAARPKRVVVVGGGVAGMEAARTAAERGHAVTLFERSDRLGGQLIAAAIPPHKDDLHLLRSYYENELERTGVRVQLSAAPSAGEISALRPDAAIVATGSRPRRPAIPGVERAVPAEDVLLGQAEVGRRVVIVGGELVGCETAEYLADRGHQVTIVRRGSRMADSVIPAVRHGLIKRLEEQGVAMLTGARYEEMEARGLVITTAEGERRLLECDSVVLAAGSEPANELAEALSGLPEVHVIGDAAAPRRFLEAIHEGMRAGQRV